MQALRYIVEQIHTVVAATTDGNGEPVTCAIDIMDYDTDGLYFLTAKGKNFYNRLKKRGRIAFTGIKGESTMTSVAVSVRAKVCEIGTEYLRQLFEKNPYMYEIYPSEESRKALTVFRIYEGTGEWFDLSKKPIERGSFEFGGAEMEETGYEVTEQCNGCGICKSVCPQDCIGFIKKRAVIEQKNCLHCGNCFTNCPIGAVRKRG